MLKKICKAFNVDVINSSDIIRTSESYTGRTQLVEKMMALRKEDESFSKFVTICEESLQSYINKFNNEKQTISNLGKCSKDVAAYIVLPAEPISREQLNFLLAYLWDKYGEQVYGNDFAIREVYMSVTPNKSIDLVTAFSVRHSIKSGLEVKETSVQKKYILQSIYDPCHCSF